MYLSSTSFHSPEITINLSFLHGFSELSTVLVKDLRRNKLISLSLKRIKLLVLSRTCKYMYNLWLLTIDINRSVLLPLMVRPNIYVYI